MSENSIFAEGARAGKKDGIMFTRHSKATYKTYEKIVGSENPLAPVDREDQVLPDVPEAGRELARQSAETLFESMNPETDVLYFVSSDEARALETANVYREVAHEQGFVVLRPEHVRGELAASIGEGEIRTVRQLSLNIDSTLFSSIFNPDRTLPAVNWEGIGEDKRDQIRKAWDNARAVIHSDDKGSWGANFFAHSEAVKDIFKEVYPRMQSAKEVYEGKFQNLIKLARFAHEKASEIKGRNVKVLAFGHENYMGYALEKYFQDHEINNCESVTLEMEGGAIVMTRRGVKATIDEKYAEKK